MKNLKLWTFVFIGCAASFLARAEDLDNQFLKFDIAGPEAWIEKLTEYVKDNLVIIQPGEPIPSGGFDCINLTKGGLSRVKYLCSPTGKVYGTIAKAFYDLIAPKGDNTKDLADATMIVTSATTSTCSLGGCRNAGHPGAQPCLYGLDNLRRMRCWHTPYNLDHLCQ